MAEELSLQERFAPTSACFGCGPSNAEGLRIRSFPADGEVVAEWTPQPHHEAFPGVLSGGIIGTLLDCHCNWTAAYHLRRHEEQPPCTVTAEYQVKLKRPTPSDRPVRLVADVVEDLGDRAVAEGELYSGEDLCATFRGTFVAVKPGHPAYGRW